MNNYVSSQRFYAFLVNMACSQRIEDLGFRVGHSIGANCLDPHLAELLHRSPTLYKGLLEAAVLSNKTVFKSQKERTLTPTKARSKNNHDHN